MDFRGALGMAFIALPPAMVSLDRMTVDIRWRLFALVR